MAKAEGRGQRVEGRRGWCPCTQKGGWAAHALLRIHGKRETGRALPVVHESSASEVPHGDLESGRTVEKRRRDFLPFADGVGGAVGKSSVWCRCPVTRTSCGETVDRAGSPHPSFMGSAVPVSHHYLPPPVSFIMFQPPVNHILGDDFEDIIGTEHLLIVEDEKQEKEIKTEEMEEEEEEEVEKEEEEEEKEEEEEEEEEEELKEQDKVEMLEVEEEVEEQEVVDVLEEEVEEVEDQKVEVLEEEEEVEQAEEQEDVEVMEEEEEVEEVEGQEKVEVLEEEVREEVEEHSNLSCTLWSNIYGSNDPEDESPLIFPPPIESEDLAPEPLGDQITELVHTLIFKHGVKEPITKEEMVELVTKEYEELLPTILEKAASCLEVIFGIDVKEVDSNTYVLVNSLGLTFEDKFNEAQTMPRNGLLIMLLGVIFLEENCAPEEKVWAFLNMVGVYAGQEHFIYGEPRKFITIDLVQENYVEYRRVLYSDPPRFEFLWGPRALAETTKMKVLEFLAKVKGTDVISFSEWYEEALRDNHNDNFESDHEDGNNPLFVTDYLESMPLGSYEDAEFELPLFDFEVDSAVFQ
ncbi:PREDICTED: melanoma-associated antigen 9-like [Dipodomys ordii]|uniref:Melanoma-associated antigen 9-like n=1 Tax=Dipodomys ordii TaxID=10020 RepID=A0A1S3FXV0_DIPOR|nr:PREDICTED: melanoma-associated antigen 9-like [Dipodomys ordii]